MTGPDAGLAGEPEGHTPLYGRVLRLRHVQLSRWQSGLLFDGVLVAGVLLALAEVTSAWAPVVLPVAVALAVKAYDAVAGLAGPLPPRRADRGRRLPRSGDAA